MVSGSGRSERRGRAQPRPEELGSLRRRRVYPGGGPSDAAGDPPAAMGDFGKASEEDKKECGHGTSNAYEGAPTLPIGGVFPVVFPVLLAGLVLTLPQRARTGRATPFLSHPLLDHLVDPKLVFVRERLEVGEHSLGRLGFLLLLEALEDHIFGRSLENQGDSPPFAAVLKAYSDRVSAVGWLF